jgi:biotin synthase
MVRLKLAGVDRLGIALDAATKEVFDEVKGVGVGAVYSWDDEFMQLAQALSIFGKGKVSTHIIVGLGETEQDVVQTIVRCVELGVLPALFAFTPIHGTALESCARPRLESYRRIQLARFLLVRGKVKIDDLKFAVDGRLVSFGLSTEMLGEVIEGGLPFQTSGCKDCNRPFYNERPLGPLYNYPRKLREREIRKIWKELQ